MFPNDGDRVYLTGADWREVDVERRWDGRYKCPIGDDFTLIGVYRTSIGADVRRARHDRRAVGGDFRTTADRFCATGYNFCAAGYDVLATGYYLCSAHSDSCRGGTTVWYGGLAVRQGGLAVRHDDRSEISGRSPECSAGTRHHEGGSPHLQTGGTFLLEHRSERGPHSAVFDDDPPKRERNSSVGTTDSNICPWYFRFSNAYSRKPNGQGSAAHDDSPKIADHSTGGEMDSPISETSLHAANADSPI